MIPKIVHRTLRQEAVDAIQQMIMTGELKPGERISEYEVAEKLGVSRGPVREALRQIEQEGLVEYTTNRGCYVKESTGKDILEADFLKIQLELMVLELLGGDLPDEKLAAMENIVSHMSALGEDSTLSDIVDEDKEFHRCIMDAAPLKRVMQIWDGTGQSSVTLLQQFNQKKDRLVAWHKEIHQELLAALKTKDMNVIRPAMMRHCVDVVRLQIDSDQDTGFDLDVLLRH